MKKPYFYGRVKKQKIITVKNLKILLGFRNKK